MTFIESHAFFKEAFFFGGRGWRKRREAKMVPSSVSKFINTNFESKFNKIRNMDKFF